MPGRRRFPGRPRLRRAPRATLAYGRSASADAAPAPGPVPGAGVLL